MEKKQNHPKGGKEKQTEKDRQKKEEHRHLESGDNPAERKKMAGKK
jgi:hypothetical protein